MESFLIHAQGWLDYDTFKNPYNTNNKCTEKMSAGLGFDDLPDGDLGNYGDMNWGNAQCGNGLTKRTFGDSHSQGSKSAGFAVSLPFFFSQHRCHRFVFCLRLTLFRAANVLVVLPVKTSRPVPSSPVVPNKKACPSEPSMSLAPRTLSSSWSMATTMTNRLASKPIRARQVARCLQTANAVMPSR